MGRLPSSTFCVAIMCSVENLEGIVITDRDGVIILEGKPEEGITSFSTMFEILFVERFIQSFIFFLLVTSAEFPRSLLKPTFLATFGVASEKVCAVQARCVYNWRGDGFSVPSTQLQAGKLGFGGNKSITAFYSGHQASGADGPVVQCSAEIADPVQSLLDTRCTVCCCPLFPPLLVPAGVAAQLPSTGGHFGGQQRC